MSNDLVPQLDKLHNLDDGIVEYFDFQLFGHIYRFRHMNSEELQKMQTFGEDHDGVQEYFYQFITKLKDDSPEFVDVSKKMTIAHLMAFQRMIKKEFGADDSSQSTERT